MDSFWKTNLTKIKGVTEFKVHKENLIYTDDASLRIKSLFINEKLIHDGKLMPEGGITSFSYFQECIYFSTWNNLTYKYSMQTEKVKKIPFGQISWLSNEGYLILKKDKESNRFSFYQAESQTTFDLESKYLTPKSILNDGQIFSILDNEITHIDARNHVVKWQLDISDSYKLQLELGGEKNGEVNQFIGVYNNILWILLNGGRFIGIDVNSGTVKYFIKDTPQEYIHGTIDLHRKGKEGCRSPSDRSFYHLDSQNGKIIGESAKGIWEIDLTKSEPHLEVWGMEDQYKNYGLKDIGYKTLLLGTDLYFIDYNALKWGIIDLPTRRVKWVSDKITEAKVQLKEIQCGGNRVYVLDGTKTLHIFERE